MVDMKSHGLYKLSQVEIEDLILQEHENPLAGIESDWELKVSINTDQHMTKMMFFMHQNTHGLYLL